MKNLGINKKTLALLLAVVLTVGCAVGGTIAWLLDKTDEVVNTFTVGNLSIDLTETPNADSNDEDSENDVWQAQIVPGYKYAKDPLVTVNPGSEACWLFVEVIEPTISVTVGEGDSAIDYTTSDFMEYTLNFSEWEQGNGTNIPANVYYKEVDEIPKNGTPFTHYILVGGKEGTDYENGYVTIPDSVTKEMLDELPDDEYTLSFKAYASQLYKTYPEIDKFTAAEAWIILNPQ